MKITEVWQNKKKFLKLCKDNNACKEEYQRCVNSKTEDELLEVVSRNFYWCVENEVLEEWLPEVLSTKRLDCSDCTSLTKLPELPNNEWLYCSGCTGLTELPALPNNEWLYCTGCAGLTELPALPKNKYLYCTNCTGLIKLPATQKNGIVYYDKTLKDA